ncbi:hypothetical protein E1301_Tti014119 [Triplophysa tibetana]|uniref:Uncharacterized protein n=1 Tax=Triplophysa tibetana TaxID=1572043 RepID=A0A5A9PS60_9TELE|nr:hypothetical protein E1301_Tti014119 [Triplophysa tibetana]
MRRTDGRGLSLQCARTSDENNREMFKTPNISIEKHLDNCESAAQQSHWRRVCRKGRLKSSDGSTASDSSFVRQETESESLNNAEKESERERDAWSLGHYEHIPVNTQRASRLTGPSGWLHQSLNDCVVSDPCDALQQHEKI